MRGFSVGDKVRVTSGIHTGRESVIISDDNTEAKPYRLEGIGWWFGGSDGELELVSASKTPVSSGKPVDHFEAGKPDEFDPSSVKTRSQRRAEILRGLTID